MKVVRTGNLVWTGAIVALVALAAPAAHALPVIPGAAGYGMSTPAGRGGVVYRVTNLNASGVGSLKACVDGAGARTCIFDISGVIKLTADMTVRNGNLTIAGQTAPSPGIMIRGATLRVQGSDVLIQHLRFRIGDDPVGPAYANRDALKIEGSEAKPVTNVVVDHCSFSWSIDEVASVWGPHDNITFSNDIFAEPLHDSFHPTDDGTTLEKHGFGVLLGSSANGGRVTMTGNLFAHIVERNPLARSRELVFVNNLVYDRMNTDLAVASQDTRATLSSVVGNQFRKGPSYTRATKPIYVMTSGSNTLYAGSQVYLENNLAPDTGSALDQILAMTGGDFTPTLISTTTKPVWNEGLVVKSTANNDVYDSVLKLAGARPGDRDAVDRRVVAEVRNRTGYTINCVTGDGTLRCAQNAGGWPAYPQVSRALPLPANHADITPSGYSNLELWLQQLDSQLAGVVSVKAPTSVANVAAR